MITVVSELALSTPPLIPILRDIYCLIRATGFGFPPHIIEVKTGEDVASKVLSFTQNCPRDVFILSATGVLSNVSLIKADTSGEAVTFEGRFAILSLSGSFLLSEIGGQRRKTGGLSVSLARPDGWVFGGYVAGVLTAGSPIQIIIGDFVANVRIPPTSHQQQILGSTGFGVTPHIIAVKTGEDVSSKIVSFTRNSSGAVCILSATGELSNVSLLQADTSGGAVTYEGRFNIRTLSGSFLPSEVGGQRSRRGGFSVSLGGSGGRSFGGYVADVLIAASPVQVILCSFDAAAAPMNPKFVGMTGAKRPPSGSTSGGLSSLVGSYPKSKRSGNRKR